jgi:hypothetical protein
MRVLGTMRDPYVGVANKTIFGVWLHGGSKCRDTHTVYEVLSRSQLAEPHLSADRVAI